MKKLILAIFIIALVVLLGTWPLTILSKIFDFVAIAFEWLAKVLDIFGWNGLL